MDHNQMFIHQDDCLIAMESGRRPPEKDLRELPPWRAVMIARIAFFMKVMTEDEVDALVDEAVSVGGDGRLKPAQ